MLSSPKGVSFLLALLIASFSALFLFLIAGSTQQTLGVSFVLTFVTAFISVYITLEFLIFREISRIYVLLDKLRAKDFKLPRKKVFKSANPLQRLNAEISAYATKKQQEIDELKKLEHYRREFLANVSHELKTPIFAAQGFIHTLIDGAVDDKSVRDKFLEKAARSLDGLDALVQDLLTLSQMEAGDIKMQYGKFDLNDLTQEVFDQLEERANSRRARLKFEKNYDKAIMVYADRQRIGQVLTNLIDNAIKYGNDGGRVIVEFESDKEHVAVTVKDDGPGIEPEHLKRIFERFYRIEKSRSRDKGGTGLGLAIVKHIMEAHKSKVSVSSKPGKGTQFRFKLDRADNH
jgi:two-component system phosphate regulon sensor histidine kinase PhoR